jgi:hypothetical protein
VTVGVDGSVKDKRASWGIVEMNKTFHTVKSALLKGMTNKDRACEALTKWGGVIGAQVEASYIPEMEATVRAQELYPLNQNVRIIIDNKATITKLLATISANDKDPKQKNMMWEFIQKFRARESIKNRLGTQTELIHIHSHTGLQDDYSLINEAADNVCERARIENQDPQMWHGHKTSPGYHMVSKQELKFNIFPIKKIVNDIIQDKGWKEIMQSKSQMWEGVTQKGIEEFFKVVRTAKMDWDVPLQIISKTFLKNKGDHPRREPRPAMCRTCNTKRKNRNQNLPLRHFIRGICAEDHKIKERK